LSHQTSWPSGTTSEPHAAAPHQLTVRHVTLDLDAYTVRVRDASPMALPAKEFQLLQVLMKRPGVLITHDELLSSLWPDRSAPSARALPTHIQRLRHRIEDDPHRPQLILAVRGAGYRFASREHDGA
jgi:DNA-binding response OmpR family regulator